MKIELDAFRNCLIRTKSGSTGYKGFINGVYIGFKNIETVQLLQKEGFTHLTVGDDDESSFIQALKIAFDTDSKSINIKSEIKLEKQ